jgi:hypothetical protein
MNTQIQQPIQPTNIVKPAIKAQLKSVDVRFGPGEEYATISILLLNEDDRHVITRMVQMTVEESEQWGTDDSYLLQFAIDKLGL